MKVLKIFFLPCIFTVCVVQAGDRLISIGSDLPDQTPLYKAIVSGNPAEARRILHTSGFNFFTENGRRDTSLHLAIRTGRLELARELLLNHLGEDFAASWDLELYHEEWANRSSASVNVGIIRSDGNTLLHEAADYRMGGGKREKTIIMLVDEFKADVNIPNNRGETPLHIAAFFGHVGIIKTLIEQGANIYAKDNEGRLPLHEAMIYRAAHREFNSDSERHQVVTLLLGGMMKYINAKDNNGQTPLHIAVNHRSIQNIEILLQLGADPNLRDAQGRLPYDIAVARKKKDLIHKRDYRAIQDILLSRTEAVFVNHGRRPKRNRGRAGPIRKGAGWCKRTFGHMAR